MENLSITENQPPRHSSQIHHPHPSQAQQSPPSLAPAMTVNMNMNMGMIPPPQGVPQLPPQMFTTSAQLLDLTDKKLMVALRDGRKLIGVLRSWDQFANLVLQSTTERIYAQQPSSSVSVPPKNLYADIYRGTYLVRGENVLLLGEIDLDKEDIPPQGYEIGDEAEVHRLAREEKLAREKGDKRRLEALRREGFEGENLGEVLI